MLLDGRTNSITLDEILDNTNNALIAVDPQGRIIYANDAVFNILEIPVRDLVGQSLETILARVEKEALIYALDAANGNKVQTAKTLGLSRAGLYKKLKKHDLH